ncbi:MAG: thioredoxin family protein [Chloroflexi bacterium]|nr:thioredoxin family protein [Chloroflexota bacterium]
MPFIQEKDKLPLKDRLRKDLKSEVKLRLFTQRTFGLTIPGRECLHCEDTQKLMEELTALSPKLKLEIVDFYSQAQAVKEAGVERIPALVMSANGSTNVKFYGIPLGLEFAALLETIVTLSRGVSPLALETRKKLKQLKSAVHIQVFVTPT